MTVKGKDVYFYVDAGGGDMQPVCCARTASLTTSTDTGETSTLGTGKWKTFKGLKMSFSISAGGLVSNDMNYSILELRQRQINFDAIGFSFFGSDQAGRQEKYTGSFIISTINTPTTYNGAFEYSVEGQGTGALTVEKTVTQFTAYWGWQNTPYNTANFPTMSFNGSGLVNPTNDILADYTGMPPGYYLIMKYPASETAKTVWFNTSVNQGTIPDQVFYPLYTVGGFFYAYTRKPLALSSSDKTINFH